MDSPPHARTATHITQPLPNPSTRLQPKPPAPHPWHRAPRDGDPLSHRVRHTRSGIGERARSQGPSVASASGAAELRFMCH
uniref:Uncharacterized protein n=1 Tax=Arundo donax TaxID=35708 RepID=A0A0A8XRE4_ARUDO